MKYKIEKNTVQETLILPLYSRKLCTELYPNLYRDETAVRLLDQIDYDFSQAEKNSRSLMQRFGALEVAMRQNDLAFEVQAYLKTHPCAAVVNLGCGLDNTGRACDNGKCKIYNLDFPDVIALRQQLLPAGEREQNIPCDLKDPAWFDKIDASGGAVFFASGVFYYFLTEQVRELVQGMADAFPGGVLVFDAANRTAVKMIAKTWLRTAKIKDVGAYFAVSDAKSELSPWDSRLQVSSRGYMLGYNDLKDPSVSGFFRFLARVGDNGMKMQIVKIRFGGQAMKILVYGAGVLGCNLARNLLRAGKDVTLLARGNWAAEIRRNGLRIKDKFSLCTSVSRIPVVTELAPEAKYDVIFVVLRYTQLDSALDTLRANRTKNIVFVGNNVQTKALAAALPEKNVLFAFALSAGHREADRVVSIDLKKITIGQLTGAKSNKQLIGRIFHGTKYKVVYEPNMEDYLLCHAAFVMPAAFACYKTDGDLKKLRGDTAYLNRVLDANIEGYRAIRDAGHTILPKEDADFEGEKYRKTCLRFFKLMCATSLGKLCASDHAMNAIDEMSALNRDLKKFFDANGAAYPVWQALEAEAGRYLQ